MYTVMFFFAPRKNKELVRGFYFLDLYLLHNVYYIESSNLVIKLLISRRRELALIKLCIKLSRLNSRKYFYSILTRKRNVYQK